MLTVVEQITLVVDAIRAHQTGTVGPAAREFALAQTALEDAQMRFTRGLAINTDRFHPADLEKS